MTPSPQVRQGGEAIKTWTLLGVAPAHNLYGDHTVVEGGGTPRVPEAGRCEVIELEPVLDLLERCSKAIDVRPTGQPWRTRLAVDAVLRQHGRLQ